jgi:LCP family protein required for cell wall assembly
VLTKRSMARTVAGRVGYGLLCVFATATIVAAGYAWKVGGLVGATAKGIAISGAPSVGAMNVLVMGLESRTDYQGNTLPGSLLTAMHAGSAAAVSAGEVGAQDTNTLILIHVFAGGQKAVGFSIPRDDLVTYPHATYDGITRGKIDQAYDFAYNQSLDQTYGDGETQAQRYLKANQAGQQFEIATVQAVAGVHVDHFAEVNLAGFYSLAQAFGGIEVCVQPWNGGENLTDENSGWNAFEDGYNRTTGGTQYLHLSAAQSLAFVRDRDTLPGTDLGRTRRQQAVLDYVIWKLRNAGVLSDLSSLNSLLSTASKYLITDSTFNLAEFASGMQALSGENMQFTTLPVAGQTSVELNGSQQDVNLIDVSQIQNIVQQAFYPPSEAASPAGAEAGAGPSAGASAAAHGKGAWSASPSPSQSPSAVTVDVYNGSGTVGLAGEVSQALVADGYQAGAVADASGQSQAVMDGTQVFYGPGVAAGAQAIATGFGTSATSLSSLPAGHVEILLGAVVTGVPAGLTSAGTSATVSAGTASDTSPGTSAGSAAAGSGTGASGASTQAPPANSTGGTLKVAPGARYGIPCVN